MPGAQPWRWTVHAGTNGGSLLPWLRSASSFVAVGETKYARQLDGSCFSAIRRNVAPMSIIA